MDANHECDPTALTLDGRLAALVEAERAIAHLQARQVRLIAAIADDPCTDAVAPRLDRDWAKEELRAALGESAESVNSRIELARALLHRLPTTLAALESGRITLRHARLLVDGIVSLGDDAAARVEATALEFGAGRDLSAFARKVRREVLKCDNRSLEEQVADALADRRVWSRPGEHAMSAFGAMLPAEGAQVLMTALTMLADQCPDDDPRSRDQRRADALVQLGIDALNGYARCPICVVRDDTPQAGTGPRWLGLRPTIQVSVALSTLLGQDEQPGELAGYGPIPAHVARRLAADQTGTWRRLVTDELGRLRDYGRTRYRPPADVHDFVVARDQTCAFPTCNRQASRCELDHIDPWCDGGPTNADNLVALCRRHHHAKHDAGWQLRRLADGSLEWTSPAGRIYVVPMPAYPIDTTHSMYVPNDNTEHHQTHNDAPTPNLAA